MYALYDKAWKNGTYCYSFREKTSLFGCNVGNIPRLLRQRLLDDSTEPLRWHVDLERGLMDCGMGNQTFMIDLKPNSKKSNISLYEVANAWGYSGSGWTPIMLHLRGLLIDEDPSIFDIEHFERNPQEIDDPIFSIMYLRGTVKYGKLEGPWTPPGPSTTNSVLLWPEAFDYFQQQVHGLIDTRAT